jgi:ribose transport system substrate-binding protein
MRRWILLALVLAIPAGCDPSRSKKLRFAFVTNSNSDFWRIASKGIDKAKKEFDVEVEIFTPLKGEAAEQQKILEDIIVRGFDGMAISPLNPDEMTSLLDKVATKMNVICHDSDAPKSKRKCYIGTNNVEAGRAAGKAVLEALGGKKGKVAIFVGRIDAQNAIERKQGLVEALKDSGLEILDVYLDKTDRKQAKANVEDALVKHADLVMCVGLWSYNGPCIASAVGASKRAEKPMIVCFDEEEETLQAVKDGLIFATVVQKPFEFGYQSVKVLKEIKVGQTPTEIIDTGIVVVKKDSVVKFWEDLRELKK